LNAIAAMASAADVPSEFTVQLEIRRQVVLFSAAFAGDLDPSTSTTLLNMFNNDLSKLSGAYSDTWSQRLDVQLLGAKLFLYSTYLAVAAKRSFATTNPLADSTQLALQLGLPTAVSLINKMAELNKTRYPHAGIPDQDTLHYPKFYFHLAVYAVFFLTRFLGSNPNASQTDRELAISHLTTAHQFFSALAPAADDFTRVTQIIEVLARNLKEYTWDNSSSVKSRLGASLLYDATRMFDVPLKESKQQSTKPAAIESSMISNHEGAHAMPVMMQAPEDVPELWGGHASHEFPANTSIALDTNYSDFQWMSDEVLSEMFHL
jgi:hypothetical protein